MTCQKRMQAVDGKEEIYLEWPNPWIVYGDFGACAHSRYQALFSPPPREPGDEASPPPTPEEVGQA